jgi:hypothetical protein
MFGIILKSWVRFVMIGLPTIKVNIKAQGRRNVDKSRVEISASPKFKDPILALIMYASSENELATRGTADG